MAHQQDQAASGVNPCGPGTIVPISISDKASLVEEATLPRPPTPPRCSSSYEQKGRTTWLMAALGLPVVGICVLLTLFLLAEPYQPPRKLGRFQSAQPPRKNIFIIDINTKSYPSTQKLEILEDCLKKNRNMEIYHISLNRNIDQPRNTTAMEKLKKKYPNFHFLFQTIPSYFRGSIFERTIETQPPKLILFKAQLLILWRYAGLVLSPTWSVLKPLEKVFTKDYGSLMVGGYNGQIGFLSVSNTCNAKLFEIMREVEGTKFSSSLEMDVMERVMLRSKSGLKTLGFPYLCNNNTRNDQCTLMNSNNYVVKSIAQPVVKKFIVSSPSKEMSLVPDSEMSLFRRFLIFTT